MLQEPILVLYKKSLYEIYCRKYKGTTDKYFQSRLKTLHKVHNLHNEAVEHIQNLLKQYNYNFVLKPRATKINYANFKTIITIGGDGTFLEAAGKSKDQLLIGVNSSPEFSVGKLCSIHADHFEKMLKLKKEQLGSSEILLRKGRITFSTSQKEVDFLNDVLIAHQNPAAMSRYLIKIGKNQEEHKSSGLWISTPVGSTGGIHSAGGKIMKLTDEALQFFVREPYENRYKFQILKGEIFKNEKITLQSYMRQGMLFVDGAHLKYDFPLCETITVSLSPRSVRSLKKF